MNEIAIIEETLFGDPATSPIARSRWFEREQMLKEMEDFDRHDRWEDDRLYQLSKDWMMEILLGGGNLYEESKNIELFRLLENAPTVSGKIVFASGNDYEDEEQDADDFKWRTDFIGYHLSLLSLRRCLDALNKLRGDKHVADVLNLDKLENTAKQIQAQLIDRLDDIEQQRLKHLKTFRTNK